MSMTTTQPLVTIANKSSGGHCAPVLLRPRFARHPVRFAPVLQS